MTTVPDKENDDSDLSQINLGDVEEMTRKVDDARSKLVGARHDLRLRKPLFFKNGLTPKFSKTASGCTVEDSLGRTFIDWTGSRGANLLGHRHPVFLEALTTWSQDPDPDDLDFPDSNEGVFCDTREQEFAEQLASLFQSGDLVQFHRGHRESIYAAIELARVSTGRKRIMWPRLYEPRDFDVENQLFRFGQPSALSEFLIGYPFNDFEYLQSSIGRYGDELAAVFLSPFAYEFPDKEYFSNLQKFLSERDILLIIDESDTAFRLTMGGIQEHFNIKPDLTIVGDTLAGQFAFSAVIGRSERVEKSWTNTVRQIDRPSGLVLSVAKATLDFVIEENLPNRLNSVTEQLKEEFAIACDQIGVAGQLVGYANRLSLKFADDELYLQSDMRRLFSLLALENGLITHGEFWPTASHCDQSIDTTIRALESTLTSFAKTLEEKRPRVKSLTSVNDTPKQKESLSSLLYRTEVRGRIDSLMMVRKTLVATGWILVADEKLDELVAYLDDGTELVAEYVERLDLADAFPNLEDAAKAGFTISLPVESIKRPSRFLLAGKSRGKVVYQTLLIHEPDKQTSGPYPFGEETIYS